MATKASPVATATGIFREHSERALFRGFVARRAGNGLAKFSFVWHHDRTFEVVLDARKRSLQIARLLPAVDSSMHADLKRFLAARQTDEYPPHRRIDPSKASIRTLRQRGNVGIIMIAKGPGDWDYVTRKLIHLVHEIFLGFLVDGGYYEYMVAHLGLDPDRY